MNTAEVANQLTVEEYPKVVVAEEEIIERSAVAVVKIELDVEVHTEI